MIDPQRMATWRAFQWANTVVTRNLARQLETDGLPIAWFDVLIHLYEAEHGRLRMQDLAESVVLTRSGITRLVDRLVDAGYVAREPSTEDRRGSYAVITGEGRSALASVWPVHERCIREYFTDLLPDSAVPVLYDALIRVIRANEGKGGTNPD